LLDNKELDIRIADFGFSVQLKDLADIVPCGTPGYVAPEIFQGGKYTYKVDIFSVGCIAYKLLTGNVLFEGSDLDDKIENNRECEIED
jgi:serine/threonine protein kinase